jgi:subtilisin family serine protease
MASDGTPDQPTIDAVQVSKGDQLALGADAGDTFTIHATAAYVADPAQSNFMAGFSSQGPTEVDYRVKPDLAAPGVNVLSSIPGSSAACDDTIDTNGCFAFYEGTSMATPHLSGSAAVVKWIHPGWDAWEIRSAITNTADEGVLQKAAGGVETDGHIVGAGRDNVGKAGAAWVALDPVSVSFGAIPGGQGGSFARTVVIRNLKSFSYDYQLSVTGGGTGINYSLSLTHINLAAGATGTFMVFMSADKGAIVGDHQGRLAVSGTIGDYAHAVVYTLVKN